MVFAEVLAFAAPDATYYEAAPPAMGILWALLLDIVILAAFLLLCFRWRESATRTLRLPGTAGIVCCAVFAGFQVLRWGGEYLLKWFSENSLAYAKVGVVAGFCLLFALRRRLALRAAQGALLIMSPLFPIATANAIATYRAVHARPFGKGSAAGMLPVHSHHNRVVWIVFDELDQHLVFESRPARVRLNQLDALRAESIYATQVRSPNPDTMPSLPSLIVGRTISAVDASSRKFRFQFAGCSKWFDFENYPNLFSRARAEGFDAGISGWHHPYCRILGNVLSDCAWDLGNLPFLISEKALNSRSFLQKAAYLAEWQAESFPLRRKFDIVTEPGGAEAIKEHSIETFQYVMANAIRMLCDQRLNLVLIHLPIPHPPGIWDAAHQRLSTGASNYVDNLQLADNSLGELRRALEKSGDWDSSTILVSSDHPYRVAWWEHVFFIKNEEMTELTGLRQRKLIPFLLKLPHQHSEVTYGREFNSVITSSLLLEILEGKISTAQQAVSWLDTHAGGSLETDASGCR